MSQHSDPKDLPGGHGEGEREPWDRERYGSRQDEDREEYGSGFDPDTQDYGDGQDDEPAVSNRDAPAPRAI